MTLPASDQALVELGRWLRRTGYRFVCPTPATHARVVARAGHAPTTTLTGALGWSRPFCPGALPGEVERLLAAAGALGPDGERLRSRVRYSTVGDDGPFVHSAYPTVDADAVFFGPDTLRFVALLRRIVRPTRRLVNVGAGSGAGGLSVADRAAALVLADVNPLALRHARVNAAIAGTAVATVLSDVLAGVNGEIDTVIANPPYLVDAAHRLYRDGGGALGFDLALRIVREALTRLAPGGQLVLYTGSPVVDGAHPLREALAPLLAARACRVSWRSSTPTSSARSSMGPATRASSASR